MDPRRTTYAQVPYTVYDPRQATLSDRTLEEGFYQAPQAYVPSRVDAAEAQVGGRAVRQQAPPRGPETFGHLEGYPQGAAYGGHPMQPAPMAQGPAYAPGFAGPSGQAYAPALPTDTYAASMSVPTTSSGSSETITFGSSGHHGPHGSSSGPRGTYHHRQTLSTIINNGHRVTQPVHQYTSYHVHHTHVPQPQPVNAQWAHEEQLRIWARAREETERAMAQERARLDHERHAIQAAAHHEAQALAARLQQEAALQVQQGAYELSQQAAAFRTEVERDTLGYLDARQRQVYEQASAAFAHEMQAQRALVQEEMRVERERLAEREAHMQAYYVNELQRLTAARDAAPDTPSASGDLARARQDPLPASPPSPNVFMGEDRCLPRRRLFSCLHDRCPRLL
ncbi:hypothetical protein SPRG_07636 [Saprolegnia parasitica CBS 223.65]|uniref:Uncharacterized protein n=1 Tax=Saprolegnia parasitica (strain CBS 223.65) TaxID=695850 RepID=A0A067CJD3_SAPPC|nr:hypothetical protein SPRG_07636 [Saprolegnia parasitica CBS 223.65]KDO26922.1 hypothetical protein SPRG_07636 [Saprolegnia parasitica CBS 223.65]|eukprot:XP_012202304.1 hypothetical protein SPRG_07636 [Saprolegnia parasitica CBS 223.65]